MKNIRFAFLFILLMFAFATAVSASSGTCGNNANWEYDDSSKSLYISGTGKIDYVASDNQAWREYAEDIETVIINEGITCIGNNAFEGHPNLKNVTLPTSLLTIGENAFSFCESLESLKIPTNVNSIISPLIRFSNIKNITVDNGNKHYTSIDGILYNAEVSALIIYPPEKKGSIYILPSSVTSIEQFAFDGNDYLEEIILHDRLEFIKYQAIWGMKSLKKLNIPKSTWYIESGFSFCYKLTDIYVDIDNPSYTSEDGVLFDKEKTKLICYPIGRKGSVYTVPDTVERIMDEAFAGSILTQINLPENLRIVGNSAFGICYYLRDIIIPESVEIMENEAFEPRHVLSSIYFLGDLPYTDYPDYYDSEEDVPFLWQREIFYYDDDHEVNVYYLPEKKGWSTLDEAYLNGCGINLVPLNKSDLSEIEPEEPLWSAVVTFDDATASPDVTESNETETSLVLGSCGDNATWNYNKNDRILTISGTGELSYRYNDGPWHDYDEDIEKVIIEEGITAINNYAFSDCIALKEIVLPSTLNTIEYSAFYNCSSLKNVVLPDSVTSLGEGAFTESGLESIILSDSMTLLDQGVFSYCHNLKSVVIPKSITTIKGYVFYQCESLETIYYTGSKDAWNKLSIDTDGNDFLTLEAVNIVFDASKEQERIEDEDGFLKTIKPYFPYFATVFIGVAVVIFVVYMANHKTRQTSKKTHIQKDSAHAETMHSNNRNISSNRNTKQEVGPSTCTACGFLCEPESLFCGNCGKSFADSNAHACPDCGKILSNDDVYCSTCGKKIK